MEYTGDKVQLDIEYVWRAAVETFPAMAEAYREANVRVHQTRYSKDYDTKSFPRWEEFRDAVQSVLNWQCQILKDTGSAVEQAIRDYVDKDDKAGAALDKVFETGGVGGEPPPREGPVVLDGISPNSGDGRPNKEAEVAAPKPEPYEGDAPTIEELQQKALVVDMALWLAYESEEGAFDFLNPWSDEPLEGDGCVINQRMRELAVMDPDEYNTAIRCLEELLSGQKTFDKFTSEVRRAEDGFGEAEWQGDAAENFRQNFLYEYPFIAGNQKMAVEELLGAVKGLQQAREAAHKKYNEIMDATIDACNQIVEANQAAEQNFVLTVFEAAVTAGATVVTGGGVTALRWALAGGSLSVTASATALDGGDTKAVHKSCVAGLNSTYENLCDFDEKLEGKLSTDLELIEAARASKEADIDLPRPAFADKPGLL